MSGQGKHRPTALLAAAAAALVLAACGGGSGSSSSSGAVREGGVFRLGTSSTIDSLNPFVAFQSDAYTTFEYIYPSLVQYNPTLKFVADFARELEDVAGRQDLDVLTPQPNAKWSDGKPLTAADAAWTFSTILKFQNGATANSAGYVAHMKSATAPNATTLVLTYSQPVANVLSQVQQVPILPEHIWAKYATGNGKALKTFAEQRADRLRRPVHAGRSTRRSRSRCSSATPTSTGRSRTSTASGCSSSDHRRRGDRAEERPARRRGGPVPPTSVTALKAAAFRRRSQTPGMPSTTSSSTPTRSSRPATRSC